MGVEIETSRLILRPWAEGDIDPLVQGLNDLALAKWLAFVPHPYRVSDAENWIKRCRNLSSASRSPTEYEFAVVHKTTHRLIGGVNLNKIDREAGAAGGGIWIAAPYQGQGCGREAFAAKIRFAFDELRLTKLINGYFDGNDRSWAMQQSLGYRRVGKVASRCLADGRQTIEHVTALLRSDWEEREA
ncbi:GNAT family N-acetyltransferase [Lacibacterium aquatile]|uniref:GNAT family N-acetyltransferase n=1 Tax=Lacibacterium aquatile TaxID=1168082 RepID=A0ABW5DSL2_9PROT